MDQIQRPGEELDHAAFARVWRRVMPEDRPDCPFTLEPSAPPALSGGRRCCARCSLRLSGGRQRPGSA